MAETDIQTVTAKFVADITNFQTAARSLVSSAKEVKSSAKDLSSALSESGDGIKKVEMTSTPAANAMRQMGAAAHESHQGFLGMLDDFSQFSGNIQQVVGMIASFIGALDKQYESTQNATRSFGNLSLSMDQAKQQYEDLASMSASKAFGVDKIVQAQMYFDRLGKSAGVTKDEIAKMADALAAAGQGGDNLIKVIDDMHKLQDTSRVTKDQIDQLAKDGIQAWDLLAFAMGVTVPEAMQRVQQGAVTGKQAYQDIMNGVIKDTGAADQKSHDLSNSWQQLGQAATRALDPLLQGLTKLLDMLSQAQEAAHAFEAILAIATMGGSLLPKLPGSSFGQHASGIMDNPTAHWATVGERGPELMYVPEHASIFSNGVNPFANSGSSSSGGAVSLLPSLTASPLQGGGSLGPQTIQIYLDSRMIAEQTIPHFAPIIRAYSGRMQ
jgi:tape measure domain-containing protein